MRPTLFNIGPIPIFSYGLFLLIALFFSLFIMWRLFKNNLAFVRFHVSLDLFFDSALVFFISFAFGARTLHVIEHWQAFGSNIITWFLFLHFPGFSFLGGVLGGILGLWLFCQNKKLPFFLLLDLMAVGFSFALGFSRIGSLLNGDSFGRETSFFLKIKLTDLSGLRHPVQLYDSIAAFAIFALLYYLFSKGKERVGMISIYFLLLIGISRFFLEMLRGDSVYLGKIPTAQVISALFVLFAVSVILIVKREMLLQKIKSFKRL